MLNQKLWVWGPSTHIYIFFFFFFKQAAGILMCREVWLLPCQVSSYMSPYTILNSNYLIDCLASPLSPVKTRNMSHIYLISKVMFDTK